MALPEAAQRMEQVVRAYTQACNDADVDGIAACFSADAEFYFPWRPKWTGAKSIGANFAQVVREQGVRWTFDQLLTDVDRSAAVLGWTRFNSSNGQVIRGVEWFVFDPETFAIREVRPYTAAPVHPETPQQELQGFDYAGRGYPASRA